jgi:signal transduction histidine kinase/CheY-like chemotaxis protein
MEKTKVIFLIHHNSRLGLLVLLTLVFNLTFQSTQSQEVSETGLPYIQNYTPEEYDGASQNWAITQSEEGLIYVGNNDGVLEFDGSSWRVIYLPNYGICKAIGRTKANKIFVGGYNELGYLEPNDVGEMQFVSLKHKLKINDFKEINRINIIDDTVFFKASNYLFKWNNEQFTTYEIYGTMPSIPIRDNIYIIENFVVKKLENNDFVDIIDLASTKAKAFTDIIGYKENELIILSYDKGVFATNNGTVEPLNSKSSESIGKSLAYGMLRLSNDLITIGTRLDGIITIDKKGNIINKINKSNGLKSNTIYNSFEDHQHGVWLATNNGIIRAELVSPFTIFDERHGIEGYVNDIYVKDGEVYLANYKGVLKLDKTGNHIFKNIGPEKSMTNIVSKQAIQFLEIKDSLFVGTRAGLFLYTNNELVQKYAIASGALMRSKKNPKRIYVGLINGMASLAYKNGTWIYDGIINGINDDIRAIKEDSDGTIWLESQIDGVWKIEAESKRSADKFNQPKVKHYKANKELPEGILFLKSIGNKVLFNIDDQVYSYNKEKDSILKDDSIPKLFGLHGRISLKMEDKNNNVWMFADLNKGDERKSRLIAIKNDDGSYTLKKNYDERITQKVGVSHFPENKNIVWYGGSGSVIRHDLSITGNEKLDFNTHIRKVTTSRDSMLFGGVKVNSNEIEIPYKDNAFRFEYAATTFEEASENLYQYQLNGFDKEWSAWTLETKKDYTNLPEGNYNFIVRSMNIYDHLGFEDNYAFTILPPWYGTWWAYVLYGLGAIGIVALYSKWRSQELQKKNVALETTINKRTLEIRQKNELLNHQTEQLVELNEAKTRLYSNITHEFRTPLTVILGMAETLKTNVLNKSYEGAEKSLEMIRRNGKNLLQLVNELLDLAKVESGNMELNPVQTDVIPFVKYLSESFHSLAESRKINLTVYSEIETLEMDIDVNKMASIISNLLSNAIKYTSANGKIIVHLNKTNIIDGEFFSIKVQDNGVGLAEKDLAHLFDRFYQVDNELSSKQEGTGIGLSLAKEFVELMNGTIGVESTLGKGSTFTVQIPVTNTAVKTLDAKITVEPPIKKPANSIKTESSVLEETSTLPLALIIEDNEDVAHYLKTCLKGKYQTMHASNGIIGIEMAYENIPDVIISDVMMPGKDGFEVCATLKSDERTDHIPIILLTAKVTTEDRLAGLSHGADAYLAKPFNEKELFIRLNQLVLLRKKLIDKIQKDGLNKFLDKKEESPESKFLQKVIQTINEDIGNSAFGSADLADKLLLSESQVYRKLKAITDKSTAVFIRSIRLQKAKELIETTDKTISEIAYDTGFNDPSWFSRAFKDEFGIPPSDASK